MGMQHRSLRLGASLPRHKSHIPNSHTEGAQDTHLKEPEAGGGPLEPSGRPQQPHLLGLAGKPLFPSCFPSFSSPSVWTSQLKPIAQGQLSKWRGINQLCFGQTWLKTPVLQSAVHQLINWWKSAPHAHHRCNCRNLNPERLCWMHPGFLFSVKNKACYLLRFGIGGGNMTARSWNV